MRSNENGDQISGDQKRMEIKCPEIKQEWRSNVQRSNENLDRTAGDQMSGDQTSGDQMRMEIKRPDSGDQMRIRLFFSFLHISSLSQPLYA